MAIDVNIPWEVGFGEDLCRAAERQCTATTAAKLEE